MHFKTTVKILLCIVGGALGVLILTCFRINAGLVNTTTSFDELKETAMVRTKPTVTTEGATDEGITWKCLSFDNEVERIISKASSTFIATPNKVAGTSLKKFTHQCMKDSRKFKEEKIFIDNDLAKEFIASTSSSSLSPPHLLSNHITRDKSLIELSRIPSIGSLIILLYRNEKDRFISAIKHVVESRFCGHLMVHTEDLDQAKVLRNEHNCSFEEEAFLDLVSEKKPYEIGHGNRRILTCNLYTVLKENQPNIVFMHYTQLDRLQQVLAKRYCPEYEGKAPMHANQSKDKPSSNIYVNIHSNDSTTTSTTTATVPFDQWLEAKSDWLEWAVKVEPWKCYKETKQMEHALFSCADEIIQPFV